MRVEETNGQGAGCSAGAGQDRRESDVTYCIWGWWCLKEICPTGEREERIWKKGRIWKECSQHSGRMRGEVSVNSCDNRQASCLCSKGSLHPKSQQQSRIDTWGLNLATDQWEVVWIYSLAVQRGIISPCTTLFREKILSLFISDAPLHCYFPILTSWISNGSIKCSRTKSCYCIQQQATVHLFHPVREWKVVTSTLGGECVIVKSFGWILTSITATP